MLCLLKEKSGNMTSKQNLLFYIVNFMTYIIPLDADLFTMFRYG